MCEYTPKIEAAKIFKKDDFCSSLKKSVIGFKVGLILNIINDRGKITIVPPKNE